MTLREIGSLVLFALGALACKGHRNPLQLRGVDRSDGVIPELSLAEAGAAPTIDGNLGEPTWESAAKTGPFVHPADGKVRPGSAVNAEARMTWDERALYVAVTVYDAQPTSPFAEGDVDPHIWSQASGIELMIQPGDRQDNRTYFEIQVGVNGAVWDTRFDDYNRPITGPKEQRRFGHQDWQSQLQRVVTRIDGGYVVEMALPWSALTSVPGVSAPTPGTVWRVNLYSFRDGQRDALAWSPILGKGNFHRSSRFGRVLFH